jgi:hypothetical protein
MGTDIGAVDMKWIKIEVYLGVAMLVSALLLSSCVQVTVNFPTSGAVEDLEALAMNRVLSPSPGVPLQEVAADDTVLEVVEEPADPAPLPTGEEVQVIDSVVANDWILQGSLRTTGFYKDRALKKMTGSCLPPTRSSSSVQFGVRSLSTSI